MPAQSLLAQPFPSLSELVHTNGLLLPETVAQANPLWALAVVQSLVKVSAPWHVLNK